MEQRYTGFKTSQIVHILTCFNLQGYVSRIPFKQEDGFRPNGNNTSALHEAGTHLIIFCLFYSNYKLPVSVCFTLLFLKNTK